MMPGWMVKILIISMISSVAVSSNNIHPYLSIRNNPCNSIVVNWWNPDSKGDSQVDHGITDSYGSTLTNSIVSNFHHVELTNLLSGTIYHYRIRSSDGTIGEDNTFTTSAENTKSFSFVAYGDPRGLALPTDSTLYHTRHKELCDWLSTQDVDFAIELGDFVWDGAIVSSNPQTKINVETYYSEFFKAEQNFVKNRPIMATMGGHEAQPSNGDYVYYYDMYQDAFPSNGISDSKGRVYSFNYGNAHFVCLSSYQIDLNIQKNWLIEDLTAARANPNIKWIFVYMHAPMHTCSGQIGRADELTAWGPVFDEFGVDIVFASHNHVYERFHCIKNGQVVEDGKGTVYITNGLGGSEFNNSTSDPRLVCWFGASNLNKTLALKITINGNTLRGQAIPNLTGIAVDTFQIRKNYVDGDFDQSGNVDMKDLYLFSNSWLNTGMRP
jgi:acid phosphatase type 7